MTTDAEALDCPICKHAMMLCEEGLLFPVHFQCEHCGTIIPQSALAAEKRAAVPVDAEREELVHALESAVPSCPDEEIVSLLMRAKTWRRITTLLRTLAEAPIDDAMVERALAVWIGQNWKLVKGWEEHFASMRAALLAARQGGKK